jgi:hypothetical protein
MLVPPIIRFSQHDQGMIGKAIAKIASLNFDIISYTHLQTTTVPSILCLRLVFLALSLSPNLMVKIESAV